MQSKKITLKEKCIKKYGKHKFKKMLKIFIETSTAIEKGG